MISIPTTLFASGVELGDESTLILEFKVDGNTGFDFTPTITTSDGSVGMWEIYGVWDTPQTQIEITNAASFTMESHNIRDYTRTAKYYHRNKGKITQIDLSGNVIVNNLDLRNLTHVTHFNTSFNLYTSMYFPTNDANISYIYMNSCQNLSYISFTMFSNLGGTILAYNCTALKYVTFPSTDRQIKLDFRNCDIKDTLDLTGLIRLYDYVKLDYNINMTNIAMPDQEENILDTISYFSVNNCQSLINLDVSKNPGLYGFFDMTNCYDLTSFTQMNYVISLADEGFEYFYFSYNLVFTGILNISKMRLTKHISIHNISYLTNINFNPDYREYVETFNLSWNGFNDTLDIIMFLYDYLPLLNISHNENLTWITSDLSTPPNVIDFSYCSSLKVKYEEENYIYRLWASLGASPDEIIIWHSNISSDDVYEHLWQFGANLIGFNVDLANIHVKIDNDNYFWIGSDNYQKKRYLQWNRAFQFSTNNL